MACLTLKCSKSCYEDVEKDVEKIAKKFGLKIDLEKKKNSFLIKIGGQNFNMN